MIFQGYDAKFKLNAYPKQFLPQNWEILVIFYIYYHDEIHAVKIRHASRNAIRNVKHRRLNEAHLRLERIKNVFKRDIFFISTRTKQSLRHNTACWKQFPTTWHNSRVETNGIKINFLRILWNEKMGRAAENSILNLGQKKTETWSIYEQTFKQTQTKKTDKDNGNGT